MSATLTDNPTEALQTVPAGEPSTTPRTGSSPATPRLGPHSGLEYELNGSYRKLSRGLKRHWFTRRPNHEAGTALVQAIHRATPYVPDAESTAADTGEQRPAGHRAKTICRYVDGGVEVLIDDIRYTVSL